MNKQIEPNRFRCIFGDSIAASGPVPIVESKKMEIPLASAANGKVIKLFVEMVADGQVAMIETA